MSRMRVFRLVFLGLVTTALLSLDRASSASMWNEPEIVLAGDANIPSASGTSVIWADGAWHIVFELDGGVGYAWRDLAGWHIGPMAAPAGSGARDPHVGTSGAALMVVWSAPSLSHREVYARHGMREIWDPVVPLSEDVTTSHKPVVGGEAGMTYVAWEDSSSTATDVMGRMWLSGSWGSVEQVNVVPGSAREPSIIGGPSGSGVVLAWSDGRDGTAQIYSRARGHYSWYTETSETSMAVDCRRPVVLSAVHFDPGSSYLIIYFEARGAGGAVEVWSVGGDGPRSDDDGIPSHSPNIAAHAKPVSTCHGFPGGGTRAALCWIDGELGRTIRTKDSEGSLDTMTSAIPTRAAIGGHDGRPRAGFLQIWVDVREGSPVLVSRGADPPGCEEHGLQAEGPVILAPAGKPSTRIRYLDLCSGEGFADLVFLQIDPPLSGLLAWDEQQEPWTDGMTDSLGRVALSLRGGGCARVEGAHAWVGSYPFECRGDFEGAKSPDVNGDCRVGMDDRDYFVSRMGTDDFCADLDGSGLVDSLDLALVDATLGDACSQLAAGVKNGGAQPPGALLRADPNPAFSTTRLHLRATRTPDSRVLVSIFDSSGRELRTMAWAKGESGAWIEWDLRDQAGRLVPSGTYYAALRGTRERSRIPVVVIR